MSDTQQQQQQQQQADQQQEPPVVLENYNRERRVQQAADPFAALDFSAVDDFSAGDVHRSVASDTEVAATNQALSKYFATTARTGDARAAINNVHLAAIMKNIFVYFGHNGTSPAGMYSRVLSITKGNVTCDVKLSRVTLIIMKGCTTIRRYFRYYADKVAEIGKSQGIVYHWGIKNGFPDSYGYLGFDFADACSSTYMTTAARSALTNSRLRAINRGVFRV